VTHKFSLYLLNEHTHYYLRHTVKKIFSLFAFLIQAGLLSVGFGQTLPQSMTLDARIACFEGNPTIELLITSKARILVRGGTLTLANDSSYVVSNLSAGQNIDILQITPGDTIRRGYVVPVIEPIPLFQPLVSSSTVCAGGEPAVLLALVDDALTVDWYDAPTGGRLLASGQVTYSTSKAGTYYAESRDPGRACLGVSSGRGAGTVNLQRSLCPLVLLKKNNI
jgi:hypothetical protein